MVIDMVMVNYNYPDSFLSPESSPRFVVSTRLGKKGGAPFFCRCFGLPYYLSGKQTYSYPIGSIYGIYGNIYHQYTPNVSIYTIHGSYGLLSITLW